MAIWRINTAGKDDAPSYEERSAKIHLSAIFICARCYAPEQVTTIGIESPNGNYAAFCLPEYGGAVTSIVQLSLSIAYAADFDDATKFMFVGKDSQECGSPMSLLYLLSRYVADDAFFQRQDDNITLPTECY